MPQREEGVHSGSSCSRRCSPAQEEKSDKERWQHLADLADFALAMKDTLTNINNQSFNNFMLRIGKGSRACALLAMLRGKGFSTSWAGRARDLALEAFRLGRVALAQLWDIRDLR